jgi:hypothetical protein
MSRGSGQPQQTEFDKLIERIVRYCQKRSPEALDRVFNTLPRNTPELSQLIVTKTVDYLIQGNLNTLGWFCGYMTSEINRSEDNNRAYLPITELSITLTGAGMQPFRDFVPYPGQRIIILYPEKVEALPEIVKELLVTAFDLIEQSEEELMKVNEAIRQELGVASG